MKYQIEVSKLVDRRKVDPKRLKPMVNIRDAAYWQQRIWKLLPGIHASVVGAK